MKFLSSDFLEGVEYTVYYNVSKKINMTSTQAEVLSWIMDEDNEDFFFNTVHYDNSARETFMTKGEPTTYTAKYSKLQFKQVSYTFTRDGEDWQGIYSLVMKGREYFIITYEAKVDLYTKYETQFKETIGDFRKVGWETSDVG